MVSGCVEHESELRDKYYGNTVEQWIAKLPAELAVDAVGLWQIVSFGREGFALSGEELVDFVRRSLFALFVMEAKPVVGALDNVHVWTLVSYGDTADEMCEAIVNEWRSLGRDPDAGDVWFALPHIYEATRADDALREAHRSH